MARRMSWEEKRREAERAAWRHVGRKHWVVFVVGPYVLPALGFLAVAAGLVVAWTAISHVVLGAVALGLGVLPLLVLAARALSGSGLQSRIQARAAGMSGPRLNLGFALSGFAVLMFAASWLALASPWS